jgi:hypothetical protein
VFQVVLFRWQRLTGKKTCPVTYGTSYFPSLCGKQCGLPARLAVGLQPVNTMNFGFFCIFFYFCLFVSSLLFF